MSSALALEREIQSAFLRGWYLRDKEHPRPEGNAAITKVEQAGWDSCKRGEASLEGLRAYLEEPPARIGTP